MPGLDDLPLDVLEKMLADKEKGVMTPVQAIHSNESSGASDSAAIVNPASGARGSMQVMPKTAKDPGYGLKPSNGTPEDDARLGREYFGKMMDTFKDPKIAAVAYNWGPGNAQNWVKNGSKLDDLPLETLEYLDKFNDKAGLYSQPDGAQKAQVDLSSLPKGYKPLTGFMAGVGNFATGATRAIVHGLARAGEAVAPESDFTKMANEALPQMDARMLANKEAYENQRAFEGKEGQTDWGRVAGEIAPALAMPMARTGSLIGGATQAGLSGAILGAAGTQPGQDIGEQAGIGALTGGLTAPLVGMTGKLIRGVVPRPAAQQLIDQGVTDLTPGQLVGGPVRRMEEKAKSVPGMGDAIISGEQAGIRQMNRSFYQQVLDPIGGTAPEVVGREGVAAVKKQITDAYDAVLPSITWRTDRQFVQDFTPISRLIGRLPDREQAAVRNILDDNLFARQQGGQWNGVEINKADSGIGKEIQKFARSQAPVDNDVANVLRQIQTTIRDTMVRQNPQQARQLSAIRSSFSRYAVLRNASKRVTDPENPIAAGQFQQAVRQEAGGQGRDAFQTGTARMQGLSDPSVAVLGSKYPDSGTAGRIWLGAGLMGGAATIAPPVAMAMAGLTALYGTRVGRRMMMTTLARRPDSVRLLGGQFQQQAGRIGTGAAAAGAFDDEEQ